MCSCAPQRWRSRWPCPCLKKHKIFNFKHKKLRKIQLIKNIQKKHKNLVENMLMSPDSSSADPDPYPMTVPSIPSMIQVPECTQSHGGSQAVIKPQHIQIVDYKKIELSPNGYLSPTKLPQPVYHQKTMVPKSEEDLNLGKSLIYVDTLISVSMGLIMWESEWERVEGQSFYYSCWLNFVSCFSFSERAGNDLEIQNLAAVCVEARVLTPKTEWKSSTFDRIGSF